jgi:hypothetical protein
VDILAPAGQLGRIDLTDDVGELRPRGQPLRVPLFPPPPGDRYPLRWRVGDQPLAGRGDRLLRVFVDRRAGDVEVRDGVVEEADERPHQAALGLPLLAEEEHVVAGDQGDVDLRDDGVFVSDDAGEQFLAGLEHAEKVIADFLLDRLGPPAAFPQGE